ncbi:Sec1 family protein [Entamoeba nuttalli P19]|uniref:Sec1 family protein n=1 Tax=Entamoeba nuttalli (strain P19) TaxID=1076696 RepID=K2G5X3_ENTNP|nr:Sec1 family protein [Entamoeba nuttalli P19]EKE37786.1 Sec1 family protein [Entamoeba nuttalli P19]|eukprot:XP_008859887.1 Sec1 family protein [Entamoeba nuttalli P19]
MAQQQKVKTQQTGIQSKLGTHFQTIFLPTLQLITRPQTNDLLKNYQDFTTETLLKTLPLNHPKKKIIVCDRHSFMMMELIGGQYLQDDNYNITDMICYEDYNVESFTRTFFRKTLAYFVIVESTTEAATHALNFMNKSLEKFNEIANDSYVMTPENFFFFRMPKFTPFDGKLLDPFKTSFRLGKIDIPVAVIQDDVFSLQDDNAFVRLFGERDVGILNEIYSSLNTFQKRFGYFPKVFSRGQYSHQLAEMMNIKRPNNEFNKEVDFVYIVDRTFDLLTPELIANNYESLIDEVYGINDDCTTVNVNLSIYDKVFGSSKDSDVAYKVLSEKKNAFITLHGNWYNEISKANFNDIRTVLNDKIKATKELQELTQQEKSISKKLEMTTHFNMCLAFATIHPQIHQSIISYVNTYDNLELQEKQFQFFDYVFSSAKQIAGLFKQDLAGPIEELLLLGKHEEALKQLAILCAGYDGIKPDLYDEVKKFFIQYCGIEELNIWSKMEMAGILKKTGEKSRTFTALNSALKLYEKENGSSFYGGYTPLIVKSLENIICPQETEESSNQKGVLGAALKGVSKLTSKNLNDILTEEEQMKITNIKETIEGGSKKIVVFVVGGITFGEIASLRSLSQKLGRPIIIGSTHIIRKNNSMINQFIQSAEKEMRIFN